MLDVVDTVKFRFQETALRNSGLILLNKIPIYKKLSRLIHAQFLLQWYIVIFYGIYLNMAPISLISLEIRMKVLSPNY